MKSIHLSTTKIFFKKINLKNLDHVQKISLMVSTIALAVLIVGAAALSGGRAGFLIAIGSSVPLYVTILSSSVLVAGILTLIGYEALIGHIKNKNEKEASTKEEPIEVRQAHHIVVKDHEEECHIDETYRRTQIEIIKNDLVKKNCDLDEGTMLKSANQLEIIQKNLTDKAFQARTQFRGIKINRLTHKILQEVARTTNIKNRLINLKKCKTYNVKDKVLNIASRMIFNLNDLERQLDLIINK